MNAVFDACDLAGAIFINSNLENADFRTASNFIIDPTDNKIKNARFSPNNIEGLLTKFKIKLSH